MEQTKMSNKEYLLYLRDRQKEMRQEKKKQSLCG